MSFWGTLAGVATSFIPGVGPLLAPLVSGAVSGLTSGGGGGSSTANGANPNSAQITKLLGGLNSPTDASANSATDQAEGYYRTILGGGQDATRSLLGPDVDTILGQYDNAAKAATQLGPRGGGRDAALADVNFQKSGAYGKLLASAKSTAATGLTTIGGQKTAAATAKRGQDVSELGTLTNGANSANELAFQKQQAQNKEYSQLGSGIGSFLTNLLKGKSGGGGGGSGSGYDPSNASFNTNSYDEFS